MPAEPVPAVRIIALCRYVLQGVPGPASSEASDCERCGEAVWLIVTSSAVPVVALCPLCYPDMLAGL